jgi:ABC-type Na+ efflux pump permease subunit
MNGHIRPAKWLIVPTLVVIAQIVIDAAGGFDTEFGVWSFIALSLAVLLIWRHRLGNLVLPRTQGEIADMANVDRSDRRFAFLTMATPVALLIAIQLLILVLLLTDLLTDLPTVQKYAGTLWTVFAITAIGFYQIALFASCWIVTRSTRWGRILKAHPPRRPVQ